MAEILLFHHALGQTSGFKSFAQDLRAAGHLVHTPDLFDGKVFTDLTDGVANAQSIGFDTIIDRGVAAANMLPNEIVYAGFSLGVMPAEKLAITRGGARGALLMSGFADPSFFGAWPHGVPAQIHIMESDEWVREEDLPAARKFAESTKDAQLFVYSGGRHLFAEHGSEFDPIAAATLKERVLTFLTRLS